MPNNFQYLAQPLAPDIIGSFNRGRERARQIEREQFADQELRARVERGNRFRELAPRALTAATPDDRRQVLGEIASVDPDAAMQLDTRFASREQQIRTQLINAARALTRIPRDKQGARSQVYQMMLPDLRAMGLQAPNQYGPDVENLAESLAALDSAQQPSGVRSELMEWVQDYRRTNPTASIEDATRAYARARQAPSRGGMATFDAGTVLSEDGSPMSTEKPPSGYRWSADGSLEPIPGGPADKPPSGGGSDRQPMPVGALRIMQDARDALSVAEGIDTSLGRIYQQLAGGELRLGPMANLISRGRNVAGVSTENSRQFEMMMSTLEKLRNDSLRLNKGVQTEGDAQRAWNELLANVNDEQAVMAQLERIREINARAAQLQQENMDAVLQNYGRAEDPTAQPSAPDAPAGTPAPAVPPAGNADAVRSRYGF